MKKNYIKSQPRLKSVRHNVLTRNVNKTTWNGGNNKLCKKVLHMMQTIK